MSDIHQHSQALFNQVLQRVVRNLADDVAKKAKKVKKRRKQ